MPKRELDILVLSDIHLGTRGCRAGELLDYLDTVKPRMLILNGDIIDIWAFKKSWFPKEHMKVVKKFMKLAGKIPVYYITGNHDEALRRYSPSRLGKLRLCDKLEITIDGASYWFFHGDIFDASMRHAKWLAKLGGMGYDLLIRLNNVVNRVLVLLGRPRMSFSKRIKNSVKSAVAYIGDFERTAAEVAVHNGHRYVVCGHIHQPAMKLLRTDKGGVVYLNSGDWIENLTSLEYAQGQWRIHHHDQSVAPKHHLAAVEELTAV